MALKHVVLVALTRGEMTGYDIAKRFDERLSFVWHATHQQVYRELRKLEEAGLIEHRSVSQPDRPDKKLYRLTPEGEAKLHEWLVDERSSAAPSVKDPLLVKLFAGSHVDIGAIRRQIRQARVRYQERLELLRGIEDQARADVTDPNAGEMLAFLALQRGIRSATEWVSWADEADRALARYQ